MRGDRWVSPRHPAMRSIALVTAALLAACQSNEFKRAPLSMTAPFGEVRGYSWGKIGETAELAVDLAPQVQAVIRPVQADPLRIVIVQGRPKGSSDAFTMKTYDDRTNALLSKYIVLGSTSRRVNRFMLAHELVHWYADGVWCRLPLALEEGLGYCIAIQFEPDSPAFNPQAVARLVARLRDWKIEAAFDWPRQEDDSISEDQNVVNRLAGLAIVERIGVEGLRTMCANAEREGRATLSTDQVLERAGLPRGMTLGELWSLRDAQ